MKYKKANKKVCTVFVDFSKLCDTISDALLFQKSASIGITGNELKLIRSMYENLDYYIRLQWNGKLVITDNFQSNIGLKQGCP